MHERGREAVILLRIIDAGFDAGVFKSAIGFLMIKRIALSRQTSRSTHHGRPAKLAEVLSHAAGFVGIFRTRRQIIQINVEVTGNEKIQPSVAIIIAPGGAGAPALTRYADLLSDVCKRAVAVIVIQPRNSEVANEYIRPAIVIVIADRHAHAPAVVGDAGLISHIFKLPIAEIVI